MKFQNPWEIVENGWRARATPAGQPRLEFHHCHIQSTKQSSPWGVVLVCVCVVFVVCVRAMYSV